jgi:hypothetical protein
LIMNARPIIGLKGDMIIIAGCKIVSGVFSD